MESMKGIAVTPGVEHSARIIEVPIPSPSPDQVLVKTIRIGIDGTDVEIDRALYGEAPRGDNYLVIGQ